MCIIGKESSFNTNAVNSYNGDHGLFQVLNNSIIKFEFLDWLILLNFRCRLMSNIGVTLKMANSPRMCVSYHAQVTTCLECIQLSANSQIWEMTTWPMISIVSAKSSLSTVSAPGMWSAIRKAIGLLIALINDHSCIWTEGQFTTVVKNRAHFREGLTQAMKAIPAIMWVADHRCLQIFLIRWKF